MRAKYLGEAVRQQRKTLGVSQALVCEGLCTAMTLSRFESGKQTPSWDCVAAISQRLGLPDGRLYAQLTRAETRLILLRKEAAAYYRQFEQTSGEERRQARTAAWEKLDQLGRCIKGNDRVNQQFILRMKALLAEQPPQKQLGMLMEAIRLTSPRFDLNALNTCLYCSGEVAVIDKIAISYSHCGQRGTAIDIYGQLLNLILERSPNHEYLPLIACNYARYLAQEERLREALEISELGRKACIKLEYYYILPRFLHIEADCHYLTGDRRKSAELYRAAYHIYGAAMDAYHQEILKATAGARLNLVF